MNRDRILVMPAATDYQNVLLIIHGVLSSSEYADQKSQGEKLVTRLVAAQPSLGQSFADPASICVAQWGQDLPGIFPPTPDQKLRLAENFIYQQSAVHKSDPFDTIDRPNLGDIASFGLRHVTDPLKDQFGIFGLTDVFYYCAEGEAHIRRTVYAQLLGRVKAWLEGESDEESSKRRKVKLHVIGHSLGTVIAHDVLFGIFRSDGGADSLKKRAYLPDKPTKEQDRDAALVQESFEVLRAAVGNGDLVLGSLTTSGSPLALMMTRSQTLVDKLYDNMRISPKELGFPENPPMNENEVQPVWRNFYDRDDVIAYALSGLYDHKGMIQDWEVDTSWSPLDAHLGYWQNPGVISKIAELIASRS